MNTGLQQMLQPCFWNEKACRNFFFWAPFKNQNRNACKHDCLLLKECKLCSCPNSARHDPCFKLILASDSDLIHFHLIFKAPVNDFSGLFCFHWTCVLNKNDPGFHSSIGLIHVLNHVDLDHNPNKSQFLRNTSSIHLPGNACFKHSPGKCL